MWIWGCLTPHPPIIVPEAASSAAVIAAQFARNRDVVQALAADLRQNPPPFVVTCARGSSDHAATYAKYLFETRLGVVTASASPSVGSVYEARQYIGGYHDARGQQAQSLAQKQPAAKKTLEVAQPKAETVKRGGNKLSYNLQRELEQLPQKLEALEAELQTLQDQVADPDFFGQPHDRTQQVLAQLAEAEQALEAAFERWEYLEGLKNGA